MLTAQPAAVQIRERRLTLWRPHVIAIKVADAVEEFDVISQSITLTLTVTLEIILSVPVNIFLKQFRH